MRPSLTRTTLNGPSCADCVPFDQSSVTQWTSHGPGGRPTRDTGRHRDGGSGAGARGDGSRVEYGATGDAVNVAARLQSLTPPGTVLVGEMTRSMVEHRFVWGPTTDCTLKGRAAAVKAAPALSAEPAVPVSAMPLEVGDMMRAPLIGREEERDRLKQSLEDLDSGLGQVVLVTEKPGSARAGSSATAMACSPVELVGRGWRPRLFRTRTPFPTWLTAISCWGCWGCPSTPDARPSKMRRQR